MARNGYKVTVYLDDNPNSITYMQTYEERVEDTEKCPISSDDLILISSECEIGISGGYTGYRLLQYYNRTTHEYVYVREQDAECEESSTDEEWVNSGSPYCETTEQGLNTGYMLQLQVQMNRILPNYGQTRYQRYKSPECGGNNCPVWELVSKQCHISVANCVATFDGTADIVEIDVNPLSLTFNQTRTVNKQDSDCENCTSTSFNWVLVGDMCGDDSLLCDNGLQQVSTNSYTVHRKYKTIGSSSPVPMDEYQVVLKTEDDEDCGYIRPQYEMRRMNGQYICDYETYTKYEKWCQYVSYDSGVTWSLSVPEVCESGDVIAYDSYDCGKPMYRWVANGEFTCVDNGDDWKLKITRSSHDPIIVECNESSTLAYSETSGISNCEDATLIDFGDCINTVACSFRGTMGGWTNRPLVHFGDYIEDINLGLLSGYGLADENTLPSNLKRITYFTGVTFLDGQLIIPESVETISCIFGSGVSISGNTVKTGELEVKMNSIIPPTISVQPFRSINHFRVPRGTVDAYKSANNWDYYADRIFSEGEESPFYQVTFANGEKGWSFGGEGLNGVVTEQLAKTTYKMNSCTNVVSIYFGNDVTAIGESAFTYDFEVMTTLDLPPNLREIRNCAFFGGGGSLSAINMSNCSRLQRIGEEAFQNSSIKRVTLHNNLSRIENNAFNNCVRLESINLPSSLTYLGERAFYQCYSLSSNIVIPNNITEIKGLTFKNCYEIPSVTIGGSVTSIGGNAFEGCRSLSSLTIGNSVTTIGSQAFWKCRSLTSVTIPDSVTEIGSGAFASCSGLTEVHIGSGVTIVGSRAFSGCTNISNTLYLNLASGGTIGENTFASCSGLTEVHIGSGCTKIEDMAFDNVVTTEHPTEEEIVFYVYASTPPTIGIGGTSSSHIPSPFSINGNNWGKKYYPIVYVPCSSYALYKASDKWNSYTVLKPMNLTCAKTRWVFNQYLCIDGIKREQERLEASFPSGGTWTEYEDMGDRRITEGTYGSCVKAIMHQLDGTDVIVDDIASSVLTSYEVRCYNNTTSGVTIGSNCSSISEHCFQSYSNPSGDKCVFSYGFTYLTQVTIQSGITTIGDNAFGYCSGITEVVIPDTVTSIGSQAFFKCSNLSAVTLSENLTSIGNQAFASSGVREIIIPNGVTVIVANLFRGAESLSSCTLGNQVTTIESNAFLYCDSLERLVINTVTPPRASYNYFDEEKIWIYVPAQSVEAYKTASDWSNYADRIRPISE